MSEIELNKIFAAVLIGGLAVMLSGFFADVLIYPKKLDEPAYPIEGVESAVDPRASAKPQKPDPILGMIASADISRGEKLSRQCAACHSFDKGGPNAVGPNMWDVVGAPKGAKEGYSYSSALAGFGGEWDYLALNYFLWKPKEYIPGTKMNYIGLKKPEDRAAIVAWLRTLADEKEPLPTEEAIAAEANELAPPEEEIAETETSSDGGTQDGQ